MRLAWKNLCHDWLRFAVTLTGIAFAVMLMIFEGSLLSGFFRASARVVTASEADLWIAARGVPSLEYAAPVPERFRDVAQGVTGVAQVTRVVTGFTAWLKPNGMTQTVMLVGAEPGIGAAFPLPYLDGSRALLQESVLVDRSNVALLEVTTLPQEIEILQRRAKITRVVEGFGSFLGNPYIFTSYDDGLQFIGSRNHDPRFLVVRCVAGADVQAVKARLQQRLPEVDVWTRAEFAARSQNYWLAQTGAGGAILLAALLGFIVGLVIVSQTIYATTMENLEEFATLKALGASRWFVCRVVLAQALLSGLAGCALGIAAAGGAVKAAGGAIPWIYTPPWLPPGMIVISALMCGLASLMSVRKALGVEPGRVFRA
jgi:putative ABC transport system permease protein